MEKASAALIILGLLLTVVGAGLAAWAVRVDEKTAESLSSTRWNGNADLKAALLNQSRAATKGLAIVAVGTLMQVVGTILSI